MTPCESDIDNMYGFLGSLAALPLCWLHLVLPLTVCVGRGWVRLFNQTKYFIQYNILNRIRQQAHPIFAFSQHQGQMNKLKC